MNYKRKPPMNKHFRLTCLFHILLTENSVLNETYFKKFIKCKDLIFIFYKRIKKKKKRYNRKEKY